MFLPPREKPRAVFVIMLICCLWMTLYLIGLSASRQLERVIADRFTSTLFDFAIPNDSAKKVQEEEEEAILEDEEEEDAKDPVKQHPITTSPSAPKREPFQYQFNSSDPRPRNLRLVFLGDSIARYQYLSLVYFLKTGQWITAQNMRPKNPCFWQTYGTGNRDDFFNETNQLLFPNEICDCHALSENRYFADPERGNYISFIVKFGRKESNGQWRASEVHNRLWSTLVNGTNSFAARSDEEVLQWSYKTWSATIRQHIAQLQPKPDFLIFNAGLHKHDLGEKDVQFSILNATLQNGMIPIYKTTTYPNYSLPVGKFVKAAHDPELCGPVFPHCLDYSWTAPLRGYKDYFDIYHLKPQHNQRMNLQTLQYLHNLATAALEG